MDKKSKPKKKQSYRSHGRGWKIFSYTILFIGAVVSLVPFIWMILTSFMSLGEAMGNTWIPKEFLWSNYAEAWGEAKLSSYILNSVIITTITLTGELIVAILAAYAFSRMHFPGRDTIFGILLSTMMIPGMVLMIPNLLTVTWLGRVGPIPWMDNWPALTIPFMGSVFAIFLLRQFFSQIPDELFDAAKIDGAGHFRMLTQIVVPLSTAPILVIIVLSFIGSWNALAWPLLVTSTDKWLPIAVGLYNFVSDEGSKVQLIMAGTVITIIPILGLYFLTQKQFTESISRSGLKG
ncbi:MAG: carbohydrate ABC transporter permease [Chloroflexi bacterium]|jgi:multiple sugar transport system permease protein|nr:carbohydrate ABC transporter permease [Chloroflexota bacterium]MBT3668967.1 carbohydrate ABC transporter permease [Chloroflexota bacterium]MBT4002109.1 carbohydrate ABC transporter permease [Chloroflexota bacterium]MBT4304938.1 carbohydrate ABC transporter permease [Chloroflexota bacterium]MBT4533299.1 carbohydrate ABC transporter permease [Chloroflexota bacterium]